MVFKLKVPEKQTKWRKNGFGQNLNKRILIVVTFILNVKPTANEIWASGVYITFLGDWITRKFYYCLRKQYT